MGHAAWHGKHIAVGKRYKHIEASGVLPLRPPQNFSYLSAQGKIALDPNWILAVSHLIVVVANQRAFPQK